MLGQFLATFGATFAGVILSFLLWFGGEKVFQYQREKKARDHLTKEIIEEISNNVILLRNFANLIERNLEGGRIPALGVKLITSAQSSAISSGELRLINDPEKRQLVRFSAYTSQEFNHFVENTELLLAIVNLKEHERALRQATERLNGLKKDAEKTAKYLQEDILDKLTSL
jgi:hypothetical protein